MGRLGRSERFGWLADWRAHRAARWAKPATGFVTRPEPRSIGSFARGKQITGGTILFAGTLVEVPDDGIWGIAPPNPAFTAEMQGFSWLDDLAACDTPDARQKAQAWTWDWIARFGAGRGPGWTPDLVGWRILRWIHHSSLLLSGRNGEETAAFYRVLTSQAVFLSRRWRATRPGLPRFQAVTGLVYAAAFLTGVDRLTARAATALDLSCRTEFDKDGCLPSRNPEELSEILTLLTWSARALTEAGKPVPAGLAAAIAAIVPILRALRHVDGSLARFHGGDKGVEGRLDLALAASGLRRGPMPEMAMGFARLSGGRTTVIVDATDPPGGLAAGTAHASTGAFELTSGRRSVIVNCGSGTGFALGWQQAARATQSHSVLAMEGVSSSRFSAEGVTLDRQAQVSNGQVTEGAEGTDLVLSHDGWVTSHGLTATRSLTLSKDGRRLSGVETLTADSDAARRRFRDLMTETAMEGAAFGIHFHLHPDVDARLDMAGTAVSLVLRSGEVWVLRTFSEVRLALSPSFYLETGRLNPRPCMQVVLQGNARAFETRIGWTLAKAKDTPLAIRDLDSTDPEDFA